MTNEIAAQKATETAKQQQDRPLFLADTYAKLYEEGALKDVERTPREEFVKAGDERSESAKWNAFNPAVPQTSDSFLGRRMQDLARGSKQVEEIAGGAIFVIGKITVPSVTNYGEHFAIEAGRGVMENSPRVGSLSETKNFGDIFEYGSEVLLESIPLFVVSMLVVLVLRKLRRIIQKLIHASEEIPDRD